MAQNPYASDAVPASSIETGDIIQVPAHEFNHVKGSRIAYGYVVDKEYETIDGKESTTVIGFTMLHIAASGIKAPLYHVFEDKFSSGLDQSISGYVLTQDQGYHPVNADSYFVRRMGSYRNTPDHDRVMDVVGRKVDRDGPLHGGRFTSSRAYDGLGGSIITTGRKDTRDITYDPDKPRRPGKAGTRQTKRHGTQGADEGKLMDYRLKDAQSDLGLDESIVEALTTAGIEYLRQAKDLDEKKLAQIFPQTLDDITLAQAAQDGHIKEAWVARAFLKPKAGTKMPKVTTLAQAFDLVSKNREVLANYTGFGFGDLPKIADKEIKTAHARFIKAQASGKTVNPRVAGELSATWERFREKVTSADTVVIGKIVMLAPRTR